VFKLEDGKAEPVNMSECINCLTCVENCPQQAITVTEI
jgi:NAD-dependent dihydropyrimidine dehydrogenase PreA subunit